MREMLFLKTCFSLLILLMLGNLQAQTGQEFWFAAPDITAGHNDQPISLRITTYDQAAMVSLSLPADAGFSPITVNVAANSFHTFNLTPFINSIESQQINQVDNNGILVTATADIAAYYEIGASNNTDIFSLKAGNALGKNFMISAQTFWSNGNYNPQPFSTTHVVASEDNTLVTITPSQNIQGHNAGTPFTVNLNKGETYTLRAAGTAVNNRFPGTTISSDKPIAVTISDDSVYNGTYGGCKDVVGDQTIPLENIGTEYVLVRGFLGLNGIKPDRIYVMATEDGTTVSVDGAAPSVNLNRGDDHEFALTNATLYIQSNKPIYVMHVTGFGCEVGMAIVPSIFCTGSDEVSFNRSQSGNFYMVVIVPAGAEGDFEINGNANLLKANDFQAVNGTGGTWMAARKQFNNNQVQINNSYRVTNTTAKFHLGIINGTKEQGCLYGYFTDFSSVQTGPIYHY